MPKQVSLEGICSQVRRDIIRMVHGANSGHPGGALGCTEYFVALYYKVAKMNKRFKMKGAGEDLFFLSNGHISPVWYSVLARKGWIPIEELHTFRKINSRLQGHPATHDHLPGIRVASGSLGQGLSVALGAALGKKLDNDDSYVFVLAGDGELQEGQNWEAAMFAAQYKLDNVILTIDWNGQQIDGPVKEVMNLGDLKAKWKSFGWDVINLPQGNDIQEVIKAHRKAKRRKGKGKPIVVLMQTDMGHGVDFMEGTHEWHGKAPNAELTERALAQLPETLVDYPLS